MRFFLYIQTEPGVRYRPSGKTFTLYGLAKLHVQLYSVTQVYGNITKFSLH